MSIVKKLKDVLKVYLENYVYWEGFLYSFERVDELEGIQGLEVQEDNGRLDSIHFYSYLLRSCGILWGAYF